ncbi:hypothetical protein L3X38_036897 [Prunus dulcis]|uniref:Uncharacterized protein n=1 Tax=Prunus dulcis TaxID=3755 RepID=A0AAD4V235_PRUDU|nr:hypothetical protein L3X38_036897 [Prunus dulcis]
MRLDDVVFPCDMEPIDANNLTFEFISSSEKENILHKSANLAVMQPLRNLVYVEKFVFKILGNEMNQSKWEFISRKIEGIFNQLSSSETSAQLLMHHFEVHKAIQLLWSMVDILGCGEAAFKQFSRQLTEIVKELDDLDVNEATIREVEEKVHQMQEKHEVKKTSLKLQKMNLEVSLEHQNEWAAQLQQLRIDAKEDLLS